MGWRTHTSEEDPGWAQLSILKVWDDPPHHPPPLSLEPSTLWPSSRLSPRLPPHPSPSKTTFLHSHYLFFVPSSFCKKQSQKPVQNHQCGCPVLYYKNSS